MYPGTKQEFGIDEVQAASHEQQLELEFKVDRIHEYVTLLRCFHFEHPRSEVWIYLHVVQGKSLLLSDSQAIITTIVRVA